MEPFAAYLLVGIVIVLIGIFMIRKGTQKKKRCTAAASAVIAEVQTEKDDDSTTYTPIFQFAVGGTTVRRSAGIYSTHKKKFRVGDSVKIRYNPERPEEFLVGGKNGTKGSGIVLLLFGLVIIAIAFTQR